MKKWQCGCPGHSHLQHWSPSLEWDTVPMPLRGPWMQWQLQRNDSAQQKLVIKYGRHTEAIKLRITLSLLAPRVELQVGPYCELQWVSWLHCAAMSLTDLHWLWLWHGVGLLLGHKSQSYTEQSMPQKTHPSRLATWIPCCLCSCQLLMKMCWQNVDTDCDWRPWEEEVCG